MVPLCCKRPQNNRSTDYPLESGLSPLHAGSPQRSMRAVAFCFVWQREGRTVPRVVASGHCGRRTAFNRLDECHLAGLEPELVRFEVHSGDDWLAMEREAVRELEETYRVEVEGKPVRSLLWRLVNQAPGWQQDIEEDTGA
jgi:hypothetical protein